MHVHCVCGCAIITRHTKYAIFEQISIEVKKSLLSAEEQLEGTQSHK